MALNLVESKRLHHEGVLDREVADGFGLAGVVVLMPSPQWDTKQIAFLPVDPLERVVVVADR